MAGSTVDGPRFGEGQEDHPRVGGEHETATTRPAGGGGSSPRWRGAPGRVRHDHLRLGIIPALAGSTSRPENTSPNADGSSPRWRGAQLGHAEGPVRAGIIPALAGSTGTWCGTGGGCRDHPRVGGEHVEEDSPIVGMLGSSPRWRGALPRAELNATLPRIIPALAGSTPSPVHDQGTQPDHPRVGGEHSSSRSLAFSICGSSPRWRGAPAASGKSLQQLRIIPALAGSTVIATQTRPGRRDHPRVGGEHRHRRGCPPHRLGSSPRWRGARVGRAGYVGQAGIIPALAGSTNGWPGDAPPLPDHPRVGGEHPR